MLRKTILALALAGCGGAHQPAPAEPHEAQPEGMAMQMPPELKTFHDVLAPRWHADKGAQRTADTCAALGDFQSGADAIAKAAAPAGASADTWAAGAKELVTAVAGLRDACAHRDQQAAFEDAFAKVHESFHHLLEASGAMHGEHEEHEHGA
jgi:hypothetical protein